jgi:predicted membrane protein
VDGLLPTYHQGFGDFTMDLRQVDFTGADKAIDITMNAGDLTILLPPRVDTTVHAKVNVGDGEALGRKWGGIGTPAQDITDNDTDGPGGGTLVLNIQLHAGNLEVHR